MYRLNSIDRFLTNDYYRYIRLNVVLNRKFFIFYNGFNADKNFMDEVDTKVNWQFVFRQKKNCYLAVGNDSPIQFLLVYVTRILIIIDAYSTKFYT